MCGIFYSDNASFNIVNDLYNASDLIKHRGPDNSSYLIYDNRFFSFHRLMINDLSEKGNQPFFDKKNEVVLLCNGEIFNHKKIKSDLAYSSYNYKSNSDCEVILDLYNNSKNKKSFDFINKLDGEFAFILFDNKNNKLIAARDELGIRPLFYGYNELNYICFASEAKSLINICEEIKPFPPGHYFYNDEFIPFNLVWNTEGYLNDYSKINNYLKQAVIKRLDSDAEIGFLLSGGLDSSLVCGIAAKYLNNKIKTFSVGINEDPIDTKYAKIVANHINSEHHEVLFTKEDVINHLEELIYHLETWDVTTIRASIGMSLLCRYIKNNTNVKSVMTGEVSDELFGYKYTDYAPDSNSFQEESIKRVSELYLYDVLRADRCISMHGLEARVPFSDKKFVKYVMSINPEIKMNTAGIGKYILRKSFENENIIPQNILFREKAAFSDAVGHSMVDYLKEYAESCYNENEYTNKIKKYSQSASNKESIPYSKESLLYREIFDKYYLGHDKLIKSYWMPNKNWDNCDVMDPSARALPNYGLSGN